MTEIPRDTMIEMIHEYYIVKYYKTLEFIKSHCSVTQFGPLGG